MPPKCSQKVSHEAESLPQEMEGNGDPLIPMEQEEIAEDSSGRQKDLRFWEMEITIKKLIEEIKD